MFDSHAQRPELEIRGAVMNVKAELVVPEEFKIEIMIAFEVMDLGAEAFQTLKTLDDAMISLNEESLIRDPKIKDVSDKKKMIERNRRAAIQEIGEHFMFGIVGGGEMNV